jgi:4-hydroxy-4-methyl-2-oxoglutarate aldolase
LTYQPTAVSEIESRTDTLPNPSTALIADACQRLNIGLRVAPPGVKSSGPGHRLIGRALPLRFSGSIEIFLEAFDRAEHGDVLVVDNKGRLDEACLSALIAHEAMSAGVAGAVLWGAHRDSEPLNQLDFAVFSYGTFSRGPQQVRQPHPDSLVSARVGTAVVTNDDVVIADADGVIFVAASRLSQVLETARLIAAVERDRTARLRSGTSLRDQFDFSQFLALRREDPTYTLRRHLRGVGAEI